MVSPVSKPEDPADYSDRRLYPRVTIALPAFLQANGERHFVQLVDVSAGGAKLDCSARVAVGTKVVLDCGSLCRSALVRWQTGGFLGVCFESELDARDASALVERSRALEARMKTRD